MKTMEKNELQSKSAAVRCRFNAGCNSNTGLGYNGLLIFGRTAADFDCNSFFFIVFIVHMIHSYSYFYPISIHVPTSKLANILKICVPAWPIYNRNPVKWLPKQDESVLNPSIKPRAKDEIASTAAKSAPTWTSWALKILF